MWEHSRREEREKRAPSPDPQPQEAVSGAVCGEGALRRGQEALWAQVVLGGLDLPSSSPRPRTGHSPSARRPRGAAAETHPDLPHTPR